MGILTRILLLFITYTATTRHICCQVIFGCILAARGDIFLKPIGMINSTITGTVVLRYIHIGRGTIFEGFKVLFLWLFASPYYY